MTPTVWTLERMIAFARAYDRESAASMDQPSPWDTLPNPLTVSDRVWINSRIACVRAALAIGGAG